MHQRNFGGAERNIALHKKRVRQCVSQVKAGSVVCGYNRPPCVDQLFKLSPVAANDTEIRTLDGEYQKTWNANQEWMSASR